MDQHPAPPDRAAIAALIPHAGSMCLLDQVLRWDTGSIDARAGSHRDPGNPLRRGGRLAALHLVEYAAQAAAVHGGLSARAAGGNAARPGMVVSLRDVRLEVDCVDTLDAALEVRARRLLETPGGWLYEFEVDCAGTRLAQGRLAVMLGAA